jgi:nitrogen-specific signal transduction histidine kinase
VSDGRATTALPAPPHAALRDAVRDAAAELEAAGQAGVAQRLREAAAEWWRGERDWTGAVARQLGVHHDINNALVGVRGNAQLLMMGPAGSTPGVRERLEVVLRESDRIREAAQRINALKLTLTALAGDGAAETPSRAA